MIAITITSCDVTLHVPRLKGVSFETAIIERYRRRELEMVVLPGGYPGVDRLLESEGTLDLLREMKAKGKWLAAICAGPRVLDKASALENKRYTAYPGQKEKVNSGTHCDKIVVKDGNVITSRGPATVYAFAYALADALGGDSLAVKNRMAYFNAFKEGEAHA